MPRQESAEFPAQTGITIDQLKTFVGQRCKAVRQEVFNRVAPRGVLRFQKPILKKVE